MAVGIAASFLLLTPKLLPIKNTTLLWLKNLLASPHTKLVILLFAFWLFASLFSVYPQKSLLKAISVIGLVLLGVIFYHQLLAKQFHQTFAKWFVYGCLFTAIFYTCFYLLVLYQNYLATLQECDSENLRHGLVWGRGRLRCLFPNFSIFYPFSYVSITAVLAIPLLAIALKFRPLRWQVAIALILFALQIYVVAQRVSALAIIGTVIFIPLYLALRRTSPQNIKAILNTAFVSFAFLLTFAFWTIGSSAHQAGQRLYHPESPSWLPRIHIWQKSLSFGLTHPFLGNGINASDYFKTNDGRVWKTSTVIQPMWGRGIIKTSYLPTYSIKEVEFFRVPSTDKKSKEFLVLVFSPPIKTHYTYSHLLGGYSWDKAQKATWTFLEGEFNFSDLPIQTPTRHFNNAIPYTHTTPRKLFATTDGDILVGGGQNDIFTAQKGWSNIYTGVGSDKVIIHNNATAVLNDIFANQNMPQIWLMPKIGGFSIRIGDEGDRDELIFPHHNLKSLEFTLLDNGNLQIAHQSRVLALIRGYEQRLAIGAISGQIRTKDKQTLPAHCAFYVATQGKYLTRCLAPPLPTSLSKKPTLLQRIHQYGYGIANRGYLIYNADSTGISQTHPHNWLIEIFTDTGFIGLWLILLALAAWVRRWFLDPSPWAWLPIFVTFIWFLEALVNFSFWSAYWQWAFILPAAFCAAWVKLYKSDKSCFSNKLR